MMHHNKNHNADSCTPTLTKRNTLRIMENICQGLLYISYLQAFNGATGKITFF